MDNKAFFKLSYGVFMLSTKCGDKVNGCITNTCMQVANSPVRVAISVLNTNYTCDLIKESGVFALSLLDETTTFETIKHWGFQSGHNVDKLADLPLPEDVNGVPYLSWSTCAVLSCKVVDKIDLGSHTMFIGEVVDAVVTGDSTAFYRMCMKLPETIEKVLSENDSLSAGKDTVLDELMNIDRDIQKALYKLAFNSYDGFNLC